MAVSGQPPVWLDEIDPAPGPPFLRMGTRALARGGWLLGGPDVQYLHKNPLGYCGLGGTGVSCPTGLTT